MRSTLLAASLVIGCLVFAPGSWAHKKPDSLIPSPRQSSLFYVKPGPKPGVHNLMPLKHHGGTSSHRKKADSALR